MMPNSPDYDYQKTPDEVEQERRQGNADLWKVFGTIGGIVALFLIILLIVHP
jgi:hypothetical protein